MPLIESQPDAVSRIYARSLFDLAMKARSRAKVEEVLGELDELLDMARADAKLGEFFASRSLAVAAREASINRIFKGRLSHLTLNFLLVLNEKGRINSLPGMVAAFDSIVQEQFGRVEVDVFTAHSLDGDNLNRVRERLAKALSKDVVVHPYVDASMIGGVKFRIGDQLVDGSIATQLRRMKDQIDGEGAAALRSKISRIIENS